MAKLVLLSMQEKKISTRVTSEKKHYNLEEVIKFVFQKRDLTILMNTDLHSGFSFCEEFTRSYNCSKPKDTEDNFRVYFVILCRRR